MASSPKKPSKIEYVLRDPESLGQTTQKLKRIARAVVGDESLAEDVVQSAWVTALQRKQKGIGLGWMRKVVRNRAIDSLRKRAREGPHDESAPQEPSTSAELEIQMEIQQEVLSAVQSLSEPYRSTVYLRYFESLSTAEIAKRLQLPEKTVATRLTRAHQQLRARLQSFSKDQGGWSHAFIGFAGIPLGKTAPLAASLVPASNLLIMKKVALTVVSSLVLIAGWFSWKGLPGGDPSDSTKVLAPLDGELSAVPKEELVANKPETDPGRTLLAPNQTAEPQTLEPPASEFGGLEVTVLDPAKVGTPGIQVIAYFQHSSPHLKRTHRSQTNPQGIAAFPRLVAGSYLLVTDRSDRGPRDLVDIEPGKTAQAELSIPGGIRVLGQVKNQLGQPVPDASIWMTSNSGGWTSGSIAGQADHAGQFELHHVLKGESIGAFAAGFAPSTLEDLDLIDSSSGTAKVSLSLSPGGGTLYGQVRGPKNHPVPNALVLLLDEQNFSLMAMRADRSTVDTWGPRVVRTDKEGEFRFDGLFVGPKVLQAQHPDLAMYFDRITVVEGSNPRLDISMGKGSTVRGVVRNKEGAPIPGAEVVASYEPIPGDKLQSGTVTLRGGFLNPAAVADQAGAYELPSLAPGEVWLYALSPPDKPFKRYAPRAFEATQLSLAEGGMAEWNPVISEGSIIEGRTLYADGIIMKGPWVILTGPQASDERTTRAEDGTFRFLNLGAGPYQLRMQILDRAPGVLEPTLGNIHPGGSPVELIAPFDEPTQLKKATVRFRVIQQVAKGTTEATAALIRKGGNAMHLGSKKGDLWTFEVEAPGEFIPLAMLGDRCIAKGPPALVRGDQVEELPDLEIVPGGTLVLRIPSIEPRARGVRAFLRPDDVEDAEVFEVGNQTELRMENLVPGTGRISFLGANIMQFDLRYEVQSGQEVELVAKLTPAIPVPYKISWPAEEATGTMQIQFRRISSNKVVDEFQIEDLTRYSSPIKWSSFLPIGKYTFEVTKNGSQYIREDFELNSLDPKQAPRLGVKSD